MFKYAERKKLMKILLILFILACLIFLFIDFSNYVSQKFIDIMYPKKDEKNT